MDGPANRDLDGPDTVRGANAIIALRCCRFNQRFEDFWAESRAA
jgi:hypothetical protein